MLYYIFANIQIFIIKNKYMEKLFKWWKYWSIWRVFLILFSSVGIGFILAYFLPYPWNLIGVIVICIIGGLLFRKYGFDALKDFFEIKKE